MSNLLGLMVKEAQRDAKGNVSKWLVTSGTKDWLLREFGNDVDLACIEKEISMRIK